MPYKTGKGGEGQELYNPNDGQYIEDGVPNKSYDNPEENKILNSMGLDKQDYENDTFYKSYVEEKIKENLKKDFDELIENDKNRLNRYKEWTINSNSDYKKYIYDDLKKGKKEQALKIWYNTYRLKSGNYNLSFEDFLNTPIKLYRATNIGEENDFANPFLSFAQNKKDAERFLDFSQNSYAGRSGNIKEITVKPYQTFGMLPSDENEIIIPNPNYSKLEEKVENYINLAKKNGINLPYEEEKLMNLYLSRKNEKNIEILDNIIEKYIYKNKE